MPRALIVSAGASSNEYLAHHVAEYGYPRPTIVPSCGEARRLLGLSLIHIYCGSPHSPGGRVR